MPSDPDAYPKEQQKQQEAQKRLDVDREMNVWFGSGCFKIILGEIRIPAFSVPQFQGAWWHGDLKLLSWWSEQYLNYFNWSALCSIMNN